MDLLNVIKSTAASENIPQSQGGNMALQSDAVFEAIKERVNADKAKAKTVNGVFLYKITKDGKIVKEWSKLIFFLITRQVQRLSKEKKYFISKNCYANVCQHQ